MGNLQTATASRAHAGTGPPKPPSLSARRGLGTGPRGPTQLGPEGLAHGPPLGLVALTLLVDCLHNQVHDVEQDPAGRGRGNNRAEWGGGSRERPGFLTPTDMRKAWAPRLADGRVVTARKRSIPQSMWASFRLMLLRGDPICSVFRCLAKCLLKAGAWQMAAEWINVNNGHKIYCPELSGMKKTQWWERTGWR